MLDARAAEQRTRGSRPSPGGLGISPRKRRHPSSRGEYGQPWRTKAWTPSRIRSRDEDLKKKAA